VKITEKSVQPSQAVINGNFVRKHWKN